MDDTRTLQEAVRYGRTHHGTVIRLVLVTVFVVLYTACLACEKDRKKVPPVVSAEKEGVVCFTMGGVDVTLEVADDDSKRSQGLMRRKHLETNRGMIFLYKEPQIMSFWMKDTPLPLSIAYIKEDGTVVNIEKMAPMVESPSHLSKGLCRFAIEMNQGWFAKHGIKAGDRIALPQELLDLPVK